MRRFAAEEWWMTGGQALTGREGLASILKHDGAFTAKAPSALVDTGVDERGFA